MFSAGRRSIDSDSWGGVRTLLEVSPTPDMTLASSEDTRDSGRDTLGRVRSSQDTPPDAVWWALFVTSATRDGSGASGEVIYEQASIGADTTD